MTLMFLRKTPTKRLWFERLDIFCGQIPSRLEHHRNHSVLFVMADQDVDTPWLDGSWKAMDGGRDVPVIKGDKVIERNRSKVLGTLRYGAFGKVDAKILEMTGKSCYDVELRFNHVEESDLGVLLDGGRKIVFKSFHGLIRPFEWITEEEAEQLEGEGDPIEAPPSCYKVQPELQGRLICITGPPGDSTSLNQTRLPS